MGTYTKRPVAVEAVQWTGENYEEVMDWGATFGPEFAQSFSAIGSGLATISTPEGQMIASVNDWIIRGVQGEFYPCKPDIFAAAYVEGTPENPAPTIPSTTLVALLNIGGPQGNTYVESVSFTAAADALPQGQYQLKLVQESGG